MIDPHAHHILFKKGNGKAQQELVKEGQEILRKYWEKRIWHGHPIGLNGNIV